MLSGWADAQVRSLSLAAQRSPGGTAFARYAAMRAKDLYGSEAGMGGFSRAARSARARPVRGDDRPRRGAGGAAGRLDSTPGRAAVGPGSEVVVARGPRLDSHDYDKLRKGVEPKGFEAAAAVPASAFALHFTSANAVFQAIDLVDDWGTDLAHAFEGFSRDRGTKDRLFTQLALPRDDLTRLYASRAIDAVTLAAH